MTAAFPKHDRTKSFRRNDLVVLVRKVKVHTTFRDLLESNAGRLCSPDIDVRSRIGSALELFASLSGENDHSIFRVDHRRIDLFGDIIASFVVFNKGFVGHKISLKSSNDA